LATAAAMVLQKLAHNRQQDSPKHPEWNGMLLSPLWLTGLLIQVATIPFCAVSIALVPQSVLAPLSGVTIVASQIIAPYVLKEQITVRDWLASIVIVAGCGLSTAFGDLCSMDVDFETMLEYCRSHIFWGSEVLFVILFVVAFTIAWSQGRTVASQPASADGVRASHYQAACFAALSGLIGGQQNIAFKMIGEIFKLTFLGDDGKHADPVALDSNNTTMANDTLAILPAAYSGPTEYWSNWPPYTFLAFAFFLAILQLSYLNKGLKGWTAVKVLPITILV